MNRIALGVACLVVPLGSLSIAVTGKSGDTHFDAPQRVLWFFLALVSAVFMAWLARQAWHLTAGQPAPLLDPKRTYTRQDFVHVAQRDGLYCARSGCGDTNLQVDHIVPWSHGGPTTLDNAQLLCAYHNGLKSDRFVG